MKCIKGKFCTENSKFNQNYVFNRKQYLSFHKNPILSVKITFLKSEATNDEIPPP